MWKHSCQMADIMLLSFAQPAESCCSLPTETTEKQPIDADSNGCCADVVESEDAVICQTDVSTEAASQSSENDGESQPEEDCCNDELTLYQIDFQTYTHKKLTFAPGFWACLPKYLIFIIQLASPDAPFLAKTSFLQTKSSPQTPRERVAFLQVFLM